MDNLEDNFSRPPEEVALEIQSLIKLKEFVQRFKSASCSFIFDEAPKYFSHVPAVMQAYENALVAFDQSLEENSNPSMTREILLKYQLRKVWEPVWSSVVLHFSAQIQTAEVSIAREFISDPELHAMRALALKFTQRQDLTKANELWQWFRSFSTSINGQNFECTLVIDPFVEDPSIDPNIERYMSFILKSNRYDKRSVALNINLNSRYDNLPKGEEFLLHLYKKAEFLVSSFYSIVEKQRAIHSGERFGSFDVFGTAIQLMTGEKLSSENCSDPIKAYVLSLDMFGIGLANQSFCAVEYAAVSVSNPDELESVIKNHALFTYHVLKGIILLFKQILLVGNDQNGILDDSISQIRIDQGTDNGGYANLPADAYSKIQEMLDPNIHA